MARKRTDRTAYRFFRTQGHAAQLALHLARAEAYADSHGWAVKWEFDDNATDGLGDHEYWCAEARLAVYEEREPRCEHEVLCAVLRDQGGACIASLGACIDMSRDYARVVSAELADEAIANLPRRRKRAAYGE